MKRSATISVMAIAAAQLVAQGGHANETATPADLDAGQAELQAFAYDDDQGLRVMTWGAGVVQPVSSRLALTAQGYVDEITIVRPATHIHDPGAGVTGHAHDEVDIVTSASVSIGGGGRVEEKRYEGNLGFIYEMPSDEAPLVLNGSGRASTEPDYRSYAVQLGASSEFFQRNTTLSVSVGYGNDRVLPPEPPPGEDDEWPATHERVNGSVTSSQLLSPRLVLRGGLALNYQFGRLENPYRRAPVKTSLFPERLPDERVRGVAFLELSYYLGWEAALHLRNGFYADDWGVIAFIPEVTVAKDLSDGLTLSATYRLYEQQPAAFYAVPYDDLESMRTGDIRLGSVVAQRFAVDINWVIWEPRSRAGSLALYAEGAVLHTDYRSLGPYQVAARVARFVLSLAY